MTAESLNAQLAQIYQTYIQSIYSKEWEDNVSAPLLMHVYDEYVTMDRKILFVGQETHSWDCNSTTPSGDLQNRNAEGFELLKAEIGILKPDVVVFLTGSKYDERINTVFKPERETILPDGYLYRLSTSDGSLAAHTFQTKHPRTLLGNHRAKMANRYREVLGKVVEYSLDIKLASFELSLSQ